jgi:hypothetical protein
MIEETLILTNSARRYAALLRSCRALLVTILFQRAGWGAWVFILLESRVTTQAIFWPTALI